MASVVYYWSKEKFPFSIRWRESYTPTDSDVAFFGYADGWNDGGQLLITDSYYGSALSLYRSNAYLTIGGDYHDNLDTYENYNIFLHSRNMAPSNSFTVNAAVNFSGGENQVAHISFAAQSGANTAGIVNNGAAANLDSNIRIGTQHETGSISTNTVASIHAQGELDVIGSVSGIFDTTLTYKESPFDAASDKISQAAAFFVAKDLMIQGNYRGQINTKNTTAVVLATSENSSSATLTGNTTTAVGIHTGGNVDAEHGLWQGEIHADLEAQYLSLVENYAKKDVGTVTVSNNVISSCGVETGGDFITYGLIDSEWTVSTHDSQIIGEIANTSGQLTFTDNIISAVGISTNNIQAKSDISNLRMNISAVNNVISSGYMADYSKVTISGNSIRAYGINITADGTSVLGNIDEKTAINVTSSNNMVGSEQFSMATDNMTAYGIRAASLVINKFLGKITVNADKNSVIGTTTNNSWDFVGLCTTGDLTVNSLRGSISVSAQDCDAPSVIVVQTMENQISAIQATNLTVDGRFYTDITVQTNLTGRPQTKYNVAVDVKNTLTAESFSGTVNKGLTGTQCRLGFHIVNTVQTGVKGDDFDLNGEIYAVETAISSMAELNLRISGTIEATKNAILGDSDYGQIVEGGVHCDDYVRIADTAKIVGDIDLVYGDNKLLIDSGATIVGTLKATYGKLSLFFNLGEVNSKAVVTTGANDMSLYSTCYLCVNLNDAVDGKKYTLLDFQGADVKENWSNRRIAFIYQNDVFTVETDADGKITNYVRADDPEAPGTSDKLMINFSYEDSKVVVSAVGTDEHRWGKFDSENVVTSYSEAERTITIDWANCSWDIPELQQGEKIIELEYSVVNAAGESYGNSIAVLFTDGKTTNFTVKDVDAGESVQWRMRYSSDCYDYSTSQWSDWEEILATAPASAASEAPVTLVPVVTDCNPLVGEPGDHDNPSGSTIRTAVARLFWEDAVSEKPIECYTLEYVETREPLDPSDVETLFDDPKQTIYKKEVTGTEALVSSLTNGSYVYWRIKAKDVDGNESKDYVYGRSFQVSRQDKVAPEFDANNVKEQVLYDSSDRDNLVISGVLAWDEAEDISGVQDYVVVYGETGTEEANWEKIIVGSSEKSEYTIDDRTYAYHILVDNISNVEYTVKIYASDLALNNSTPIVKFWPKDATGPAFTTYSGMWDYGYEPDFACNATVTWAPTTDDQSGVKSYSVYYVLSDVEGAEWTFVSSLEHVEGQTEDYFVTISNLQNESYTYRIDAVDFCGNTTTVTKAGELKKDAEGPVLDAKSLTVTAGYNTSNPSQVFINTNVSWSPGYDELSGVKEYTFTYWKQATPEAVTTIIVRADEIDSASEYYTTSFSDFYSGSVYEYQFSAVDFCGNTSNVLTGSFGGDDVIAPSGSFLSLNAPVVTVDYEIVPKLRVVSGSIVTSYVTVLDKAQVMFSWSDTYTDSMSPVCYKVQLSNSESFDTDLTYTFYNTPADDKVLFLDNDVPTMSVGVLTEIAQSTKHNRIYWRVMAMDNPGKDAVHGLVTQGNETKVWSSTQYFYFTEDGKQGYLEPESRPAEPENLTVGNAYDATERVYQAGTYCGFTLEPVMFGVQNFDVHVYAADGSDNLYNYNYGSLATADSTQTTILLQDAMSLGDGYYEVLVITKDAVGNTSHSDRIAYLVDTTRPTTVTGIRFNQEGTTLNVSWNESYDANGIAEYVMGYRYKTLDDSAAWNWISCDSNCATLRGVATADYEFVVYAFDNKFAELSKTESNRSLASNIVSYSTQQKVVRSAGDLNCDGRADVLLAHTEAGFTGAWLINDFQLPSWDDLSNLSSSSVIFGTGYTNSSKLNADVYVYDAKNRVLGAWITDSSGKVTNYQTIGAFNADTQVLALGDFNGDGQSDLLLRSTNGAVGSYLTTGATAGWNYFKSLGDEWTIAAVGDFNGDGITDTVLEHEAGFSGCWLTQTDGTVKWTDLDTLDNGFRIAGSGDFDGDGVDDVLLEKDGYYGAWIVANGNAAGWMGLGNFGDVSVEQIADFNDDGVDDLRIRTANGDLGTLLISGADQTTWKYYGSVGSEWNTSLASL